MTIKKILIITYDWMPRNSIAVHRPYSWAKYWSKRGHAITVLTSKKYAYDEPLDLNLPILDSVDVVEVSYRKIGAPDISDKKRSFNFRSKIIWFLKKYSSQIKKTLHWDFDIRDAWAKRSRAVALDLHKKRRFDLVVSTFGPRACHFIAAEIKSADSSVIWLADYRDLWSIRHNLDLTNSQIQKEQLLEKKVVSKADILSTVSKPLAQELSQFLGKKVNVVFNGFDAEWSQVYCQIKKKATIPLKNLGTLKIVYTGMLYPVLRDPTPLFIAINNLIRRELISENDIMVHFFGHRQPQIKSMIADTSAENFVLVHGHVSREVALREQASADLLLLLESGRKEANGVLTGKIFEYMISGTPIISLGSAEDSAIAEIIAETGVGVACGSNVSKIESILLQVLRGGITGIYAPDLAKIKKYDRRSQSDELFEIISNIPKS
jgi:glycosyltransferase involved in cell wall biosynthesis